MGIVARDKERPIADCVLSLRAGGLVWLPMRG